MKRFVYINFAILMFLNIGLSQFVKGTECLGPSMGLYLHGSSPIFGVNYEDGTGTDVGDGILGWGGILRYWSWNEDSWNYTGLLFGIQANYHFIVSDGKFDPWIGLTLGYDFGWEKSKPAWAGTLLGGNAGARYWFSENLAGSARIGLGSLSYSAIDIGVDFKF